MKCIRHWTFVLICLFAVARPCHAGSLFSGKPPKTVLGKLVRGTAKLVVGAALLVSVYTAATLGTAMGNQAARAPAQTVVYSAGHADGISQELVTAATDFAMYAPVTLRQNLLGHKVLWKHNATTTEIATTIGDTAYKNVVFVGHGENGGFWAKNGDYSSSMYAGDRKSGELLQFTCGGGSSTPFSDVMLKDPSKSFAFEHPVYPLENWAGAWKLVGNALFEDGKLHGK